jgi:hypothetical protein
MLYPIAKGKVRFREIISGKELAQLRGTEYSIPGFEEYRVAIVSPRTPKGDWVAYELSTGTIISSTPHYLGEERAAGAAMMMFESAGKVTIDKCIQMRKTEREAK